MEEYIYVYIMDYTTSSLYRSKLTKKEYNDICDRYEEFEDYLEKQGYKSSNCYYMISNEETDLVDIKLNTDKDKPKYLYVLNHLDNTIDEIDIENENTDNIVEILLSYGFRPANCHWMISKVQLELSHLTNK